MYQNMRFWEPENDVVRLCNNIFSLFLWGFCCSQILEAFQAIFTSFVCCCGWSFPAAFVCLIRYLISKINSIQQSNDIKMTFLSIFLSWRVPQAWFFQDISVSLQVTNKTSEDHRNPQDYNHWTRAARSAWAWLRSRWLIWVWQKLLPFGQAKERWIG